MKQIKEWCISCLAICLLLFPTACSQSADKQASIESGTVYFPTKTDRNQVLSATMADKIVNVDQLYNEAENVIIATIADCEPYSDDWVSFVFSQVEVEETLKGNLQKGDQIIVSETGKHLEDGSDLSIDGVPLLYPGMKVILFLDSEVSLPDRSRTGYGLTGSYVGKFIYHPDGSIYSFSLLGGEHVMTLSDAKEPMTEEQFRALLPQESTTAVNETTAADTMESKATEY